MQFERREELLEPTSSLRLWPCDIQATRALYLHSFLSRDPGFTFLWLIETPHAFFFPLPLAQVDQPSPALTTSDQRQRSHCFFSPKCLVCDSSFCWVLTLRRLYFTDHACHFLSDVSTSDLDPVFLSWALRRYLRSPRSSLAFLHRSLVLCTSASMQVIDSNVVSYTAALCCF